MKFLRIYTIDNTQTVKLQKTFPNIDWEQDQKRVVSILHSFGFTYLTISDYRKHLALNENSPYYC